jgi:hypothetical protein
MTQPIFLVGEDGKVHPMTEAGYVREVEAKLREFHGR